ncbi:MAG: hypothetical protein AB8B96_14615 [Lysobacterales bacterium]
MKWWVISLGGLYCIGAVAQPSTQQLGGRVLADEQWRGNQASMPVGLISDMMVVGTSTEDEAGVGAGAVWSFKRVNGQWVQMQKILPENPQNSQAFGWSLSVDEQIDTGEAWLAVGSPRADGFFGRVDLYQRAGDTWEYVQTLSGDRPSQFGFDVAINVDIPIGQPDFSWTVGIGAPGYRFDTNTFGTGAVHVSNLNSLNLWTPPAVPLGLDAATTPLFTGIGTSVALDGDMLVAGAPSSRVRGQNGAGVIYTFNRGAFSPFASNAPIENPDPIDGEQFGGAGFGADVAVSKQIIPMRQFTGNYTIVVGAPTDTSEIPGGQMYIINSAGPSAGEITRHTRPDRSERLDFFGWAVAVKQDLYNGDHEVLVSSRVQGDGVDGAVFSYNQADLLEPWLPTRKLIIANGSVFPLSASNVGHSLAAWNNLIAAGSPSAAPGNDAVYTNPLVIYSNSWELISP